MVTRWIRAAAVALVLAGCGQTSGNGGGVDAGGGDGSIVVDASGGEGSVGHDASIAGGADDAGVGNDASDGLDAGGGGDAGVGSDASGGQDASDGGDAGEPHVLTGIVVAPANPLVLLDLDTVGSQAFTVSGKYEDGTSGDVTAQATFAVASPAVGAMSGATLSIPAFSTATATTSLITATVGSLSGQAQITVVAYPSTGAQPDVLAVLPYPDAGGVSEPLEFSTNISALDVFFLMDTTGSMVGEINSLKAALTGTVIPGVETGVSDAQFGVGAFEDFPVSPYDPGLCTSGDGTTDQPFKLRQAITGTTSLLTTAIAGLTTASGGTIGCGGDTPESGIEGIYQAATGDGLTGPSPTSVPVNHGGVGGVGFRAAAMPVIVPITDAISHGVGEPDVPACDNGSTDLVPYGTAVSADAHSRAQAKTALGAICARVVGIAAIDGTACGPLSYLTDFATSTGARIPPAAWDVGTRPAGCAATQCCTGQNGVGVAADVDGLCPEVFQVSTTGAGVSNSVVTGVTMLTRFATFEVTSLTTGDKTDITGNPLPVPHTTADFVQSVVPTGFTLPPPPPAAPNPTFDTMNFQNVTPGTTLAYSVSLLDDFVPATNQAQLFSVMIEVLAGGCTPLDRRTVLILVPPIPIAAP